MQPSPSPSSYYSPPFPTMQYPHHQYSTVQQPSPSPSPHHQPHPHQPHPHPTQYVYPPTYPQSPYLCLPTPSTPPTHSQYPVQHVHVIPSYMPRAQMHQPMHQPMHQLPVQQYVVPPKETPERDTFYAKLHAFREHIGEPIQRLPTLGFKELDLWVLYKEVTKRRGIDSVIAKKQWKEVAEALQLPSSCTDSGFRLRLHYKKYLEAFERKHFRPPPTKNVTKEAKKLERACSVVSTDSTVTQLAGENSGSSRSGSRTGAGSSSDSMKRVTKKKRRAPGSCDKGAAPDSKRRAVTSTKANKVGVGKEEMRELVEVERGISEESGCEEVVGCESDKTEAKHNLRVLEAAVMAVDGNVRIDERKKVDFSVLDDSTLKRYAKAYDVRAPKNEEKEDKKRQLAESVSTHFSETRLVDGERETLLRFIQAIKRV